MTTRNASTGGERRLVLLITGLGMGGAETQLVQLAKGLTHRGWVVRVISMLEPIGFVAELEAAGIAVHSLRMRRGFPDPRAIVRLRSLLREIAPDVVHSHMVHANLLARVTRLFTRVPRLVCTAHSVNEGGRARELAYRLTDGLADVNTHITEQGVARFEVRGAVPRGRMQCLPNGVDLQAFTPAPLHEREAMRRRLGVQDRFVWLCVGRLEDVKNHAMLLQAMTRLDPQATLLLVGTGPLEASLQERVRSLGLPDRVQMLGARRDVPSLLAAADGFVLSSRFEGLPLVLLEAAAAGVPAVTPAVGGCCDVVRDRATGIVCEPHSENALADAMAQLMALPAPVRGEMGCAARAHVTRHFDLQRVLDRWETVYRAHGPTSAPSCDAAFFLPNFAGGGAERAVIDAATSLHRRGYRTVLLAGRAEGPYRREIPDGVTVVDLAAPRTLAATLPLANWLRRHRPPVLLSALSHANVVAVWAKRLARWRGRLVVSERNNLSETWRSLPPWKRFVGIRLLRAVYTRADAVVSVSHGVADDLAHTLGLPALRGQVLHNATAQPSIPLRAAEATEHPWCTAGAPPFLLAVGRLEPQKDYDTMLRALRVAHDHAIASDTAMPRLLVLGEGRERARLEQLARSLGVAEQVHFAGHHPNPFAFMAKAHALVMSSRFEGLPNVLIQSLAAGCPVISTDCPSGPSEILANGAFGTLVPVGDAQQLGDAMHACLVAPRRAVNGEAILPFTPDAVTDRLTDVLRLRPLAGAGYQ